MRRLLIIYFWLIKGKNNVSFSELVRFLLKPKVDAVAGRYVKGINRQGDFFEVSFNTTPEILFWPGTFPASGINQVVAETFDKDDWHYYQKEHTVVDAGEVLVDVGAAEGLLSLVVAHRCQKVILIEPNRQFAAALRKSFQPYSAKVRVHQLAVADAAGEMNFDDNSLEGKIGAGKHGARIEVTTVDELLKNEDNITYLKADLEGYEESMLKGAKQTITRFKPKMAITTYHTENKADDIVRLVKSFVPEYKHYVKGIHHSDGKPVMVHFWV